MMIRYEGRAVSYGEVWFDEAIPAAPDVDILKVRQSPVPIAGRTCTPFLSLVSDLRPAEDDIFSGVAAQTRYEIRRAETRDDLEYRYLADARPELATFCDFYDAFAQQKGLFPAYRRGLSAACAAGRLSLSAAARDGQALVWHAFITYGRTTTMLHTASLFRGLDTDTRTIIARANRWLHWRDMLTFKEQGYERFCWGGMFEDESEPERANINQFKRRFGGRDERTYNCTIPVTAKGRVCLKLLALLDARAARKVRRQQRRYVQETSAG